MDPKWKGPGEPLEGRLNLTGGWRKCGRRGLSNRACRPGPTAMQRLGWTGPGPSATMNTARHRWCETRPGSPDRAGFPGRRGREVRGTSPRVDAAGSPTGGVSIFNRSLRRLSDARCDHAILLTRHRRDSHTSPSGLSHLLTRSRRGAACSHTRPSGSALGCELLWNGQAWTSRRMHH